MKKNSVISPKPTLHCATNKQLPANKVKSKAPSTVRGLIDITSTRVFNLQFQKKKKVE